LVGRPCRVKYVGDDVARAADIYSTAFPDMHRELSDLYVDGDVVVVQLTLHGTHLGDLPMGLGTIPATGKEFTSRASMSSVLRTGR
jgi:predicted ester cyclase